MVETAESAHLLRLPPIDRSRQVIDALSELLDTLELRLTVRQPRGHLLCLRRVVPEVRGAGRLA